MLAGLFIRATIVQKGKRKQQNVSN